MNTWSNNSSLATALLVLGTGSVAAVATAEPQHTPRIVVQAEDPAGAGAAVLARARQRVTAIYRAAGVDSTWIDVALVGPTAAAADAAADARLLIMIVPRQTAELMNPGGTVLGVTPYEPGQRGRVAYLFYDRIDQAARALRLDPGVLLGSAIGHEIGHMLLPEGAHAPQGIMRGRWTSEDLRTAATTGLWFAEAQAGLIRSGLLAGADSSARGRAGQVGPTENPETPAPSRSGFASAAAGIPGVAR